jgi:hypothetical protein
MVLNGFGCTEMARFAEAAGHWALTKYFGSNLVGKGKKRRGRRMRRKLYSISEVGAPFILTHLRSHTISG